MIHPPLTLLPPFEWLTAKDVRVLAVAGIANPERFRTSLLKQGWNVVDMLTFPDHHRYDAADVETIAKRLAGNADVVVTTSKDALKFKVIGPVPFPLYEVNMVLNFDPAPAPFEAVKAVLR